MGHPGGSLKDGQAPSGLHVAPGLRHVPEIAQSCWRLRVGLAGARQRDKTFGLQRLKQSVGGRQLPDRSFYDSRSTSYGLHNSARTGLRFRCGGEILQSSDSQMPKPPCFCLTLVVQPVRMPPPMRSPASFAKRLLLPVSRWTAPYQPSTYAHNLAHVLLCIGGLPGDWVGATICHSVDCRFASGGYRSQRKSLFIQDSRCSGCHVRCDLLDATEAGEQRDRRGTIGQRRRCDRDGRSCWNSGHFGWGDALRSRCAGCSCWWGLWCLKRCECCRSCECCSRVR